MVRVRCGVGLGVVWVRKWQVTKDLVNHGNNSASTRRHTAVLAAEQQNQV